MSKKNLKGWLKHWDFILLDIIILQLCFVMGFWLFRGFSNPYKIDSYRYQAILLFVCQIIVIIFFNNYKGILSRKKWDEGIAIIKYTAQIFVLALIYMFLTHDTGVASRLQMGSTAVLFMYFTFLSRYVNKKRIFSYIDNDSRRKSICLVTSYELLEMAKERLYNADVFRDFRITRIMLLNKMLPEDVSKYSVPVTLATQEEITKLSHEWIDEVFILQPDDMLFPTQLMDDFMTMGITVNYTMSAINDDRWPFTDVRKLGQFKVLTNSVKFVSPMALFVKRIVDIIGGFVGCIFTGIIFLFVAPAIYKADPGPIFFTQERIGRNGRRFKLYKFRSMYQDAEARKSELMSQNKIEGGLMFKMDDDPRILGSEKKDKNGKPKGIGNFIRRTSLDEFPQFWNVLKGDLSLVGWRPCTIQEWEAYSMHHRIRASMKPGITGMWQVSGRSEITDFEEVVRLDREYIENWSFGLDIKILLKTIEVVLKGEGSV